jgi:hypothetical protein
MIAVVFPVRPSGNTHRKLLWRQQIAREAYASTESNLYVISPEMSHVGKEFAAADPAFWTPKRSPNPGTTEAAEPSATPTPKQRR